MLQKRTKLNKWNERAMILVTKSIL